MSKTFRTSLNRVEGLGSAKDGTGGFVRQRVTGLANIPLTIFIVWLVIRLAGAERAEMTAAIGNPLVAAPLILAIVSVTLHMRIGVQEVIDDYIHGEALKRVLSLGNLFFVIAIAGVGIVSTLMLAFGG